MKDYHYIIMIGRFSPFHIGHQQVIQTALDKADEVIIMVGSSFRPRTIKNPWGFSERKYMIEKSFSEEDASRITILPLRDYMYNDDAWVKQVQNAVHNEIFSEFNWKARIGIIGHEKDESSFYLKLFPQWEHIEHEMNEVVHATDIRTLLLQKKNFLYLQGLLPTPVFDYIKMFRTTGYFEELVKDFNFIEKYKNAWKAAPYPPTFVTVDAVVVQSGHILTIVRKDSPGANLLALPGGFLDGSEYIESAVIRELIEETKIDVPEYVLKNSIKKSKVFDHPNRSSRGRTITHVFLIELSPGPLPIVEGSDDARLAKWMPFGEINSEDFFEDHHDIITYFINII